MNNPVLILYLEDNPRDAELVRDNLQQTTRLACELRVANDRAEYEAALAQTRFDVILSDYKLPNYDGMAALALARVKQPHVPFILVSGTLGEEKAVDCVLRGATDYVLKQRLDRLVPALLRALTEAEERRKRREAEEALCASEVRYRRLFESAKDGILILDAETGMVVDVNPYLVELLGSSPAAFLGKKVWELGFLKEIFANQDHFAELREQKSLRGEDKPLVTADGRKIDVEFVSNVYQVNDRNVVQYHIRDITARKQAEANRQLVVEALRLLNRPNDLATSVEELVRLIKRATGLEAVGLRLREGNDFPYYVANGFSEDFVRAERYLCAHDPAGELVRDPQGHPVLECMCGGILCGRTNPALPFFTAGGSFWANSTTRLLATTTEADRQALTRNRCNSEGYESVALIPLRTGGEIIGLLQLNDRRPNQFTPEIIRFFEGLGASIGIALSRKRAAAALRESEEKFRRLIESSPDAIMTFAPPSWMFISGNPATVKLFGAKNEEEFISLGAWELSPERQPDGRASAEKSQEMIATAVRAGSHYFEWPHRRIGGEEFPADVLLTRMEQGGKVIVQATVRDITARKAGERHLREQNDILTNSHEGVMIVNLANEISLWNCGAEALFGWTAAEALGRPPEKVLGVDDLGGMSTLRAAVERDGFWNGELRSQTRDGRQLIVDCRITLVRDEAGRPRAQLSFLADITAEKLLEEKFLHVQRLESLGMLAAGIAHDFNNALAPILMAGQLLHQYVSDPGAQHLLGTVEKSADRSVALVRQLLSFARGASGHSQLLQVRHVLHEVIELAEATFPKSIRVESDLPGDLWPVQGSPTQIHQIFLNLCVNARDAMPEGGELTLTAANCTLDAAAAAKIAEARPGAFVTVEVRDTGTGIPPEVLAQIWEPFFTTKGEGKGTGLGLSTVRGILHHHAGFITVQTQAGHGTAFTVYLPAVENETAGGPAVPPMALPRGNGELILVVDDEELVCELTAQTLICHGYRAVTACDGADAIAVFVPRAADVRLLLTDLDMPVLGGAALARTLRRLQPDLRIIAMSGAGSAPKAASCELMSAFLAKPFQPEALLPLIHRVLHEPAPPTAPHPPAVDNAKPGTP